MLNLEALDRGAQHPFSHFQWDGLRQAMIAITYLGELYVILGVLLIACLLFIWRERLGQAMILSAVVLTAVGLTYLTKYVVNRERPNLGWGLKPQPETPSFPSGHALNSAALYGTLGMLLARNMARGFRRRLVRYSGVILPFLIGASRLYVNHNYLTDVLAGWAAGTALALIGAWLDEPEAVPEFAESGGTSR